MIINQSPDFSTLWGSYITRAMSLMWLPSQKRERESARCDLILAALATMLRLDHCDLIYRTPLQGHI